MVINIAKDFLQIPVILAGYNQCPQQTKIKKDIIFILLFRLTLSALHYNENSDRLQKVTADGRPRYSIKYPKAKKGGYALQPVKGPPTYGTFIQFNVATLINKIERMLYVKQVFFSMLQGQDKWHLWRSLTITFDTCNSLCYFILSTVTTETSHWHSTH